jgi:hypothetical protein
MTIRGTNLIYQYIIAKYLNYIYDHNSLSIVVGKVDPFGMYQHGTWGWKGIHIILAKLFGVVKNCNNKTC